MNADYNNNFSALRGLSFVMVVLYHYTYQFGRLINRPTNQEILHFCGYGVYLFFILSGKLIGQKLLVNTSAQDFAISRAIRIYPTYAVCVLFSFILFKVLGSYRYDLTVFDLLSNLSFLVFLNDAPRVDGVYWSLYLEVIFYFYIFLLLLFKRQRIFILAIAFLLILLNVNETLTKLLSLNYTLVFFAYGMLQNDLNIKTKILGYIAVLLLCFINMRFSLIDLIILILIYNIVSYIKLPFYIQSILSFFGKISYSGYLLHQGIFYSFFLMFYGSNYSFYFSFLYSLVLTAFCVMVVYVFIEAKLTKKIYGFFK